MNVSYKESAAPLVGAACLFISLWFTGCQQIPVEQSQIIARVGDKSLTTQELSAWKAGLGNQTITPQLENAFIRNWIDTEILVQVAIQRGLEDDPWVESRLKDIERQLLTARLIELNESALEVPPHRRVVEYHQRHSDEFLWTDLHLTVNFWKSTSRIPLDEIRSELMFDRPRPLNPSGTVQVDSGRIEIEDPSQVDPNLWRHFGWMNEGQTGYPVQITGSYWLFQVVRRDNKGSEKKLEDVYETISHILIEQQRKALKDSLLTSFKEKFLNEGRLVWYANPTNNSENQPIEENH